MISKETESQLHDLYYTQGNFFGRDKLHALAKSRGIKVTYRDLLDWLSRQEVHQVYMRTTKTTNIQSTVLSRPHEQIGIDLIDMQNFQIDGYNYILTGIDLFSKKVYAVPMKSKAEKDVIPAMKKLLKQVGTVKSIRSDRGSEFVSAKFKQLLKDNNIVQLLSKAAAPQSNGNIERTNGIIKRMIRMSMKVKGDTFNWAKELSNLINNYNSSMNTVTKQIPNQLDKLNINDKKLRAQDRKLLDNVKGKISKSVLSKREGLEKKFEKGDRVRIKLDAEDRPRSGELWSKQIYTIYQAVKPTSAYSSPWYRLKDQTGAIVGTRYYTNDLQKIGSVQNAIDEPEKYEISKIVRPLMRDGEPHLEIAWKGYRSASSNTIEPRANILKDAPKLLKHWEAEHEVKWYKNGRFAWNE
jgi:transposase InsO family protein